MNARDHHAAAFASATAVGKRVDAIDWARISVDLDARAAPSIERLISPSQCQELSALYRSDALFRSRVVMGRHGFGRGEYRYFGYPLPGLIAGLRTALYPRLAPIANRWHERNGNRRAHSRPPRRIHRALPCCGSDAADAAAAAVRRRATTIACTRISTASTSFRCSWRSCCRSRAGLRGRRIRDDRAASADAVAAGVHAACDRATPSLFAVIIGRCRARAATIASIFATA